MVAYGAYKLHDKTTQALVDSYSSIGEMYARERHSLEQDHLHWDRFASELEGRGTKDAKNARDFANHNLKRAIATGKQEERLLSKAASKNFGIKERANAAGKILTKGSTDFKLQKQAELVREAEKGVRKKLYGIG